MIRQALILLLLLAVVLSVPLVFRPTWSALADSQSQVSPEVRERIHREGRARVLVRLRLRGSPHVPEGQLGSSADVNLQRSDIAWTQSQVIARLVGRTHGPTHRYQTVPFLALEVDSAGLAELEAAVFHVERIVEDRPRAPSLPQSVPLIQADRAWTKGYDGTGTVVAILDTGVDRTHPFLVNKVVEEACYSTTTTGPRTAPGSSAALCPNGSQTGPGVAVPCSLSGCWHGTHVAGIAAGNGAGASVAFSGVAKGAQIMAVQVFSAFSNSSDCGGSPPCVLAWDSDVISGLERVYALHSVYNFSSVNLSLGGGISTAPCDGQPHKLMIDNLRAVGIATVIAAGNDSSTTGISAPGCISSAVSVGSTTKTDGVSSFSNVASFMSLFAPGQSITSSIPGSGFGIASGTSMATPHVTGTFAILKQAAPTATVDQILSALQTTGVPITDTRSGGTVTKPRIRVADALAQLAPGSGTALSVNPATVAAGGTVTVMWSGITSPTPTDWIGLYPQGASANAGPLAWMYVSCSQTAGAAAAGGSCAFRIPNGLGAGTYEMRLLAQNGYTLLATSGALTVTAPSGGGTATLSVNAASVAAGGTVTVTWSGITSPTPTDWIGLYPRGATDSVGSISWVYVSCSQTAGAAAAAGSCASRIPSGLAAGMYEVRLFGNNSYTRLATSNAFSVTP